MADFVNNMKNNIDSTLREAPPVNRKFDEGYVLLGRPDPKQNNEIRRFVGAFSGELYVMARAGKLPCQIEKRPELYRADGTEKTPFELAMIPHKGHRNIERHFVNMTTFKNKTRATLPAPMNKFRLIPEFLKDILDEKKLVLFKEDERKSAVDDVKINLRNPKLLMSRKEQLLHYTAQWMAIFLGTVVGFETAVVLGITTFPAILLPVMAGYFAQKCAKDFALFDMAEGILRDSGWMFDKQYAWTGKLDVKKTIETAAYGLSILGAMGLAAHAAWTGMMGMSWWAQLAAIGAPAIVTSVLPIVVAAVVALTAAVATWIGLSNTVRYFWTLSPYKNMINPKEVDEALPHLPFVDKQAKEEVDAQVKQDFFDVMDRGGVYFSKADLDGIQWRYKKDLVDLLKRKASNMTGQEEDLPPPRTGIQCH